jgi:DNA polymerase-3 subunit delta'
MPFSSLLGHEAATAVLRQALANDRLATGYLFVGPPHVGKTTLALALAQEANCERLTVGGTGVSPVSADAGDTGETPVPLKAGACGECSSCRRIAAGSHPDVRVLRPSLQVKVKTSDTDAEEIEEAATLAADMEDALIRTEAIGELLASASLAGVEARRRVYIIENAEAMNPPAANRLLKTLEEPPADTTFVLTTARPGLLLPTILSRCQMLSLHPLGPDEIAQRLAEFYPLAPAEQRQVVAGLSAGAWGRARRLMEEPAIIALRTELLDLVLSLPRAEVWESLRLAERLADLTERWWLADEPGELGARMLKQARDRVLRSKLREVAEVIESAFRDMMVATAEGSRLINADRTEQLRAAARAYPPAAAVEACRQLDLLRTDLRQNANLRLALEALFIRLLNLRR